jgi:hypothetical protein
MNQICHRRSLESIGFQWDNQKTILKGMEACMLSMPPRMLHHNKLFCHMKCLRSIAGRRGILNQASLGMVLCIELMHQEMMYRKSMNLVKLQALVLELVLHKLCG